MKTIWKFDIDYSDLLITMPEGAQLLCVKVQHGRPRLWALVDPDAREVQRHIATCGTGDWLDGDHPYVGTFQTLDGTQVDHVFDHGEVPS